MLKKTIVALFVVVFIPSDAAMNTQQTNSPKTIRLMKSCDSPRSLVRKIVGVNKDKLVLSRVQPYKFELSIDKTKEISVDDKTLIWSISDTKTGKTLYTFLIDDKPQIFGVSPSGNRMAYIKTITPINYHPDKEKKYNTLILKDLVLKTNQSFFIESDLIPHSLYFNEQGSSIIVRGNRDTSAISTKKPFQMILLPEEEKEKKIILLRR